MTTTVPEVIPPEGLLPPPFMSSRKPWMSSNVSSVPSHDISNVPYQEHRVGFHPVVGTGSGTKIFTSGNRSLVDLSSTKFPVIPQPSISFVNSMVATYLIVIIVVSVSSNLIVMLVTARKRPRGRSKSNRVCILSLAMADILFSLLIHSVKAAASLGIVDIDTIFSGQGCNYYGFGMMFFGTFSMCVHASVSVIRYVNICHLEKAEWFQLKYVYVLMFTSLAYASGWAVGPFLEWGRYETFEYGCTITFSDSSKRGRMYVTLAVLGILFLPLGVLITCYTLIAVQALLFQRELGRFTDLLQERSPSKKPRMSTRNSSLMQSLKRKSDNGSVKNPDEGKEEIAEEGNEEEEEEGQKEDKGRRGADNNDRSESIKSEFIFDKGSVRRTQRSLRLQAKLIRLSMVIAGGYLIAWMPYATVCIWLSYGNSVMMPEGLRLGASLFCKSATAYNPFIYFFMSESFREDVRNFCCRRKRPSKLGNATPVHVNVSRAPSQPASIHSLEVASLRSRSIRGDSVCQRVPSIRKSPTFTIGSLNSDGSLDSSLQDCASMSPPVDSSSTLVMSPRNIPDHYKGTHLLKSPSSPIPIYRMRSLPYSVSPTRSPNCMRRLSSTPYNDPQKPPSRRSSFHVHPDAGPSGSGSNNHNLIRTGMAGRVSSYSLRLPPKPSPKLDRRRGRPLSQSFRTTAPTRVTVHRRESWMGLRTENYQSKSTREIQRDLESIITNEFHGDLKLEELNFDLRKEDKQGLTRKKSWRGASGSPKLGETRPPSRTPRQSFHGPRKGMNNGNEKRETPNFLEIPKITKSVWEPQDRGPVRSRSLHGRPTDYRPESSKRFCYSEY